MSAADRPEDDVIDRLVREHLDRRATELETAGLQERVRAMIPVAGSAAVASSIRARPVDRTSSRRRGWLWPALAAAGLMLAFLGGRYFSPAQANAAVLLRDVQAAHSQPVDRLYQVQFAPDPRYTDPSNPLDRPTDNTLWTRGDRFWCDCALGDNRLAVGRDENGQLWCAPSSKKGILLPSREEEISREIRMLCAINSMSIPRLVDEVLAGFTLHADAPLRDATAETSVIWARLRPDETHPLFSAAVMEVDTESDVVRRLVLWVVRDGHPHGTVTYTLVESGVQDDEQYRLAAHINADAEIVTQQAEPSAATDAANHDEVQP